MPGTSGLTAGAQPPSRSNPAPAPATLRKSRRSSGPEPAGSRGVDELESKSDRGGVVSFAMTPWKEMGAGKGKHGVGERRNQTAGAERPAVCALAVSPSVLHAV